MSEESSAYADGVLDVGILVPVSFENPLKEESADFLADVLLTKKKVAIPVASVLGAFHIATMYLGVPRVSAKTIFGGLLRSRSPALYPHVAPETASTALDYAASYALESWDGYLVSTALGFGARVVYSLDEELKRVREVTVVNPFSTKRTREYHAFLSSRAGRGRKK